VLVAADTTGDGHITEYPSEQSTTVVTIPFPDVKVSSGSCHFSSIGGRSLQDRMWV
jgi:hypothetical protein